MLPKSSPRPSRAAIVRDIPHPPHHPQGKQLQLKEAEAPILLAALLVDREETSLSGIIDTRIGDNQLVLPFDPKGIVVDQHLHLLALESLVYIQAEVVEMNLSVGADQTLQVA